MPTYHHLFLATLAILSVSFRNDIMYEPIRCLQFLQKRIYFAAALTTSHRIPRRQIWNNGVARDRAFSTRLQTKPSPLTTVSKRGLPHTRKTSGPSTRLFGSKRGVPGNNPLGTVSIYDEQEAIKDIDETALRRTVERISKILGYETYDVTLLLVDDEEMRETNLESRGIDAPTDILSFPFHEHTQAGILEEPEFDVPDYYTLGDMVVDVPYVIRRCKEDLELYKELEANHDEASREDDDSSLIVDDGRGVSGAMASVHDAEKRIRMLLVHGMLHLVGYDHIEDDDYIEMVEREEELLKELGEL